MLNSSCASHQPLVAPQRDGTDHLQWHKGVKDDIFPKIHHMENRQAMANAEYRGFSEHVSLY